MKDVLINRSTITERRSISEAGDLKRVIGRWSLTALIINSVVGAGIFGLPRTIAIAVGDSAPIACVLGAMAAALIVFVVVELSSQHVKSGGAYIYVRSAFGPFAGIQTGAFSWLARISTAAAVMNLLMTYLAEFYIPLNTPLVRTICMLVILSILTGANIIGVTIGTWISNAMTVAKLLPLLLLIVFGVLSWSAVAPGIHGNPKSTEWKAWADALLVTVFAYSGFESAMIPGGEIKEPRRNTPIAAFTALTVIACVYWMLQLVVMRALPDTGVSVRPLADAATVYVGEFGGQVIAVAAVISTLGWLTAAIVTAPRLTYSMATERDLPAALGRLHQRFHTPWVSISLWSISVAGLSLYGDFSWNVILSVSARLVVYTAMCLSVMRLRRLQPLHDAWRIPFGKTIPVAGMIFCGFLGTRLQREHVFLIAVVASMACLLWLRRRTTTALQ